MCNHHHITMISYSERLLLTEEKMRDVKAVSYILFRASRGLWLKRQPLVALRNYSEELGAEPGLNMKFFGWEIHVVKH